MHRAAIALAVVVSAASAGSTSAGAAGGPIRLQQLPNQAGFCVPASGDPLAVPRAVRSVGVTASATKPIAVLDTGVDPDVPELAGRVLPGIDAATGGPVSGDGDGHGTEVAGLAAGAAGAVGGVSPTSQILPVKIFDTAGTASADVLAKGIAAAVSAGATVINISASAKAATVSKPDQQKISRAIDAAFAAGVLVVAAGGNDGDGTQTIPGSLPHVLTVGGATAAATRASFSNTGPWVDVLAPAEGLITPLPRARCDLGYGNATGSSFAAPAMAGAAALITQLRPELTTQQRFEVLRRAAQNVGPAGRDDESGFGMLDVSAAMTASPPPKETSSEVDDDPFWLRGKYTHDHPLRITRFKRTFKGSGSVSPAKDPADLYPVSLRAGDRLVVNVDAADTASLLDLSIMSPKVGDFDITNGVDKQRLLSIGGLSSGPDLDFRAKTAGRYYIAVEAADPIDPQDPSAFVPATEPYTIGATATHKKAKKRKAKKR